MHTQEQDYTVKVSGKNRTTDTRIQRQDLKVALPKRKNTSSSAKQNRVSSHIEFTDVLRVIQNIDAFEKKLINEDVNEANLIEALIRLDKALSKHKGYYDRNWFGDESIGEVFEHLNRVASAIYNHKLISTNNEDEIEFRLHYTVNHNWHGSHIPVRNIIDLQDDHPELFELLFYSLAHIVDKYGIPNMFQSYFFQGTLQMMQERQFDENDKCEDSYGISDEAFFDLLAEYDNDGICPPSKWFTKLSRGCKKERIKEILEKFESPDKDINEFLIATQNLVDENSGKVLTDFYRDGYDEEDDSASFIEGFTMYWADGFVTEEAMHYINDNVNNSGIVEPTLSRDPLKDKTSEKLNSELIVDLQNWFSLLNTLLYE